MTTHHHTNWIQVLIGGVALLVGLIFYIFDRPTEHIYFLPQFLSMYVQEPLLFGQVGNHLPTFLHVIAFSLIVAGVISCRKRGAFAVCLIWLLIDSAFEIGQHQNVTPIVVELLPQWFSYVPILSNTENYFAHGVFDLYDMLSTMVGSVVAYLLIRLTSKHLERP